MAVPLYFIEGLQRLDLTKIDEFGLTYAFQGRLELGEFTGAGPGGETGCVCAVNTDKHGYFPAKQTWIQIPPKDLKTDRKVFVGVWNDFRPKPEELLVERPINGRFVKLEDGNEWMAPIARAWSDKEASWTIRLPGVLKMNVDGGWTSGGIKQRYVKLWDVANAWWSEMMSKSPDESNTIRFDFSGAHDAAAAALSANYRIGRAEIALLGLFDDQYVCASEILNTLIDLHTFMQWAKKNIQQLESDGSLSNGGEAATTTRTVQP